MALREFNDADGRQWTVWETFPATESPNDAGSSALSRFMASQPQEAGVRPSTVRAKYRSGWLTFASGSDRRRLVPIPDGWQTWGDDALRECLTRAEAISPAAP